MRKRSRAIIAAISAVASCGFVAAAVLTTTPALAGGGWSHGVFHASELSVVSGKVDYVTGATPDNDAVRTAKATLRLRTDVPLRAEFPNEGWGVVVRVRPFNQSTACMIDGAYGTVRITVDGVTYPRQKIRDAQWIAYHFATGHLNAWVSHRIDFELEATSTRRCSGSILLDDVYVNLYEAL